MRKVRDKLPSPALVVAIGALVVAMAGTGIALPGKNTVSSNDIKRDAVRSKQIKDRKVKPHDLNERTRLWAEVTGNGNLGNASKGGVVASEGVDGIYTVDFNAGDLDTCAAVAQLTSFTPGGGIPAGEVTTEIAASSSDTIRVGTSDSTGNSNGRGFTVAVFC